MSDIEKCEHNNDYADCAECEAVLAKFMHDRKARIEEWARKGFELVPNVWDAMFGADDCDLEGKA